MYAFVDQPVAGLEPGGRFVLWAMRAWIESAAQGACPPGRLAAGFARHAALPALPPLHRLLGALNRSARGMIAFHPLQCGRIGDDEAVLLQLWRDARENPPHAQETLALLLEAEQVPDAFDALLSASARLRDVGLGAIASVEQGLGPAR